MTSDVADYYTNLCNEGCLSPRWAALKEARGLTCAMLGETISSIVENKLRKKSERVAGGEDFCKAYYIEDMEEAYGGGSKWIKIAGPDTEFLRKDGSRVKIDEIAHLTRYKSWLSDTVKAHLDHDPSKVYDLNIKDVKYSPKDGLWILPDPTENFIKEGLFQGLLKPSLEVKYNLKEDLKDFVLYDYEPIGLGLMTRVGAAQEPTSGPSDPPTNTLNTAKGGKDMTNQETEGTEPNTEEQEKKKEVAPPTETVPPKQETQKEEIKTETIDEIRAKLEKEYRDKVEALSKKDKTLEDELKKLYIKVLPEGLVDENSSIEEIKLASRIYNVAMSKIDEGVKQSIPSLVKSGKLDLSNPNSPREITPDDVNRIKKKVSENYKYRVPPNPGK